VIGAKSALLIVDDNEDNRYTLTRRLQREGYWNLTAATEGQQAFDLQRSKSYRAEEESDNLRESKWI